MIEYEPDIYVNPYNGSSLTRENKHGKVMPFRRKGNVE